MCLNLNLNLNLNNICKSKIIVRKMIKYWLGKLNRNTRAHSCLILNKWIQNYWIVHRFYIVFDIWVNCTKNIVNNCKKWLNKIRLSQW